MAWKLKYRCKDCGYEAEVYEGRGLFRQQITPMTCPDCKTTLRVPRGHGKIKIVCRKCGNTFTGKS